MTLTHVVIKGRIARLGAGALRGARVAVLRQQDRDSHAPDPGAIEAGVNKLAPAGPLLVEPEEVKTTKPKSREVKTTKPKSREVKTTKPKSREVDRIPSDCKHHSAPDQHQLFAEHVKRGVWGGTESRKKRAKCSKMIAKPTTTVNSTSLCRVY